MRQTLFFLLVLGVISLGCSGNNKAATPEKSSSSASQPASPDNSNATSPNSSSTAAASMSDQNFVNDAAKGNRAEVTLGKMVAAKTHNPDVKQFAQMMVKDHTAALNQLQQVAQKKNMTLPDGLPDDAQQLQSKLSSDTGKQLDKDYMDGMVEDHQKDVQEFQAASQNVKDPDVKEWASNTLPVLQKHLDKAQQVDSKVNGGKSSPSGSSSPTNQ